MMVMEVVSDGQRQRTHGTTQGGSGRAGGGTRHIVPTAPEGPPVPFCHLRTDYRAFVTGKAPPVISERRLRDRVPFAAPVRAQAPPKAPGLPLAGLSHPVVGGLHRQPVIRRFRNTS